MSDILTSLAEGVQFTERAAHGVDGTKWITARVFFDHAKCKYFVKLHYDGAEKYKPYDNPQPAIDRYTELVEEYNLTEV